MGRCCRLTMALNHVLADPDKWNGTIVVPESELAAVDAANAAHRAQDDPEIAQREVIFFTSGSMQTPPSLEVSGAAYQGAYSVVRAKANNMTTSVSWKLDKAFDLTQVKMMGIVEALWAAMNMAKRKRVGPDTTFKIFTDDQVALQRIEQGAYNPDLRSSLLRVDMQPEKCLRVFVTNPIVELIGQVSNTIIGKHKCNVEIHWTVGVTLSRPEDDDRSVVPAMFGAEVHASAAWTRPPMAPPATKNKHAWDTIKDSEIGVEQFMAWKAKQVKVQARRDSKRPLQEAHARIRKRNAMPRVVDLLKKLKGNRAYGS
ncbi:hypothetical protein B0T17DRAFT_511614 [Bombardia bombarda]|uniref:Uncharacterized protein n=1 Tax=Bombardia bombarda TaxID=252184 RepID=A0AA39U740_9PEZI|nr:hypothetical protein B0T17DRAFT_511614 [Bombardia bombarda]